MGRRELRLEQLERAPDGRLVLPPLDDDDSGWIRLVPLRDALIEAGNELASDLAEDMDYFQPSPSTFTCYLRKPITRADWEMLNAKFVIPDDICLVRDSFVRDGPARPQTGIVLAASASPAILACYWNGRREPAGPVARRILAMLAGLADAASTMPVCGLAGPWLYKLPDEPAWLDKRKRKRRHRSVEWLPTDADALARLIADDRPNIGGGPSLDIPTMFVESSDDGGLWKLEIVADHPGGGNHVLLQAGDFRDVELHRLLVAHAPGCSPPS